MEFDHDPAASNETKRFLGERYDADAGLLYLNARYYDPKLAMFIQPDWFEVAKAGVGPNRYAYSHNDPVNKMDPGGNALETVFDIGFVAYDLISLSYAYATDDEELFDQSLTDLAVDAASMAVPGMPGGSTHVARAIDGRIIAKAGRTEFSARVKREIAEKGLYSPGRGEELHHIGEAGGKSQASKRVREMLEEAGIDVSGAENGVGLVHHKGRHRDQYARELVERLDALAPDKVKSEIKKIGQELREIDAGISDGSIKGRTGRYSPKPATVREWVMRQEDKRRNK